MAPASLDRVAVVFKRPLPYLYLAREVFGGAGLPYQASDALPLAAEPFAAALDLVFEFVESGFTRRVDGRAAAVAAFRVSARRIGASTGTRSPRSTATLSEQRYLGGLERLTGLDASMTAETSGVGQLSDAARTAALTLAPL